MTWAPASRHLLLVAGALAVGMSLRASAQPSGDRWLETPVDGTVASVACTPDAAYLLGEAGSIARFDGTTWSDVPALEAAGWGAQLLAWPDGRVAVVGSSFVTQLVDGSWVRWPLDPRIEAIGCALGLSTGEIFVGARGALGMTTGDGVAAYGTGSWRDVESLAGTARDDLWVAEDGGVVRHWDGASWERTATDASYVGDLVAFARDDVWALTSAAALHWDGHAWSRVGAGLEGHEVVAIGGMPGHVYAATRRGIFRLHGGSWRSEHEFPPTRWGRASEIPRGICMTRTHVVVAVERMVAIAPR